MVKSQHFKAPEAATGTLPASDDVDQGHLVAQNLAEADFAEDLFIDETSSNIIKHQTLRCCLPHDVESSNPHRQIQGVLEVIPSGVLPWDGYPWHGLTTGPSGPSSISSFKARRSASRFASCSRSLSKQCRICHSPWAVGSTHPICVCFCVRVHIYIYNMYIYIPSLYIYIYIPYIYIYQLYKGCTPNHPSHG